MPNCTVKWATAMASSPHNVALGNNEDSVLVARFQANDLVLVSSTEETFYFKPTTAATSHLRGLAVEGYTMAVGFQEEMEVRIYNFTYADGISGGCIPCALTR